jgi:hypothetical protein
MDCETQLVHRSQSGENLYLTECRQTLAKRGYVNFIGRSGGP